MPNAMAITMANARHTQQARIGSNTAAAALPVVVRWASVRPMIPRISDQTMVMIPPTKGTICAS